VTTSLLLFAALLADYGNQDACFDYERVVQHSPVVQQTRSRIDDRFREPLTVLQNLRGERSELMMGRELLDDGSEMANDLDMRIEALDRRIERELREIQYELDQVLTVASDAISDIMYHRIEEARQELAIETLHPACADFPHLDDVTDAVLSHILESETPTDPTLPRP
jgi:Skp family chaperone for outer membrane proteins